MSYTHQEYVLDDNGKFCRRTTVTTPIINADEMIAQIKDEGTPILLPFNQKMTMKGFSDEKINHSVVFMQYTTSQHTLHALTSMDYFPFKDADLVDHPELPNRKVLYIPRAEEPKVTKQIKWYPAKLGFSLHTYTYYNMKDQQAGPMYIFLMKDGKAYFPNLPNVFGDGRLCSGTDYLSYPNSSTYDAIMEIHQKNHQLLYDAPCNNDLRDRAFEKEYVQWDEAGNTVAPAGFEKFSTHKSFFIPSTHSVINDFISKL